MIILDVQSISRRFGGVQALCDVSFKIPERKIIGVIGPNGAGKTTLFNALVGLVQVDQGAILLEGHNLAGMKPHKIAARGMTKTFQNVALFSECTVLDNVIAAGLLRHGMMDARTNASRCLERVGLQTIANKRAADLSFPERARAEFARALCTEPKVLLLDEIMAALNAAEMQEMLDLIRSLRDDGLTLLIVEHHMRAIMAVCDRVLVLNFGRLIADGTPQTIASDPVVIEAYLGHAMEAAQ